MKHNVKRVSAKTASEKRKKRRLWIGCLQIVKWTLCVLLLVSGCVGVVLRYPQQWYQMGVQQTVVGLGKMGYRLHHLVVEGRHLTASPDILKAIILQQYDPIFQVSLRQIHHNLHQLPWVRSVTVRRQLPDTLIVNIQERKPIAIWQHQRQFFYVDSEGVSIPLKLAPQLKHRYPICVGDKANQEVDTMLRALQMYPLIQKKIRFLNWIRHRRWDMTIHPNLTVLLPELHMDRSLNLLNVLLAKPEFCCHSIAKLDLRDERHILIQFHDPFRPIAIQSRGKSV